MLFFKNIFVTIYNFVEHYKDWLVYLRIWNEPNNAYWRGTPADYAKLVQIACRAAKRSKPDIKIIIEVVTSGHEKPFEFLDEVQKADINTRSSKDFHQLIWEDNPVSNVGMGTVNISAAVDDEGFRRWVAEESLKPLPENREELEEHMQDFFDQLVSRITQFSDRKPMVKILRVMAAFFPRHFCEGGIDHRFRGTRFGGAWCARALGAEEHGRILSRLITGRTSQFSSVLCLRLCGFA